MPSPRRAVSSFALATLAAFLLAAAAPAQVYRLDDRAEPLSQEIRLHLDPARLDYSGSVTIAVRLHRASDTLRFHAEGMELERVVLRRPGTEEAWPLAPETGQWGTVSARAGETLAPGDYSLEIDFRRELGTQALGLYRAEQGGEAYLFTHFEPDEARKAFPCWDEPEHKIPYRLTLEVPAGLEALSNTPIARESETDGTRTVVFEATPPMPSYLLALAVGPFDTVEIPGTSVPARVVTPRGQGHLAALAVRTTPPLLAALERYFERPYPYAKLDLVAVPEFWYGAMENPGAITFTAAALLADEAQVSFAQRLYLSWIVAHELAHIWFGDLVTMRWWNDLWLNESFAEWMAERTVAETFPELERSVIAQEGADRVMLLDARPSTVPIRRPVVTPEDVTEDLSLAYGKGKEVLKSIERWVGPDAFRTGVLRYLEKHAWGNATAEDLWAELSEAAGKDVRPVLAGFLEQSGLPLITATVTGGDAGYRLVLEQERFHNAGIEVPPQLWTVPLEVTVGYGAGDAATTETLAVLLDGPRVEVPLAARPDWVLPHAGANGYYRWRVPDEMLVELAAAADRRLTPVERVGLIGNAGALLDAGLLGGDDYLALLNGFADDPDEEVVRSMLQGLSKVRAAFVPDDLLPAFGRYLAATLGPVAERFGLEPRPDEAEAVSLVRSGLLYWLTAVAKDEEALSLAHRLATDYLEDPARADPALTLQALYVASRDGDVAWFESLRKRFEAASDPADRSRLLWAMAALETPAARERALAYTLEGPLHAQELFIIPFGQITTEANQDRAFRWVVANLEALAARIPEEYFDRMPQVASGCSLERLRAAERAFADERWRTDGVARSLEKVSDQVHDCVRLREREGAAVRAFLLSFG